MDNLLSQVLSTWREGQLKQEQELLKEQAEQALKAEQATKEAFRKLFETKIHPNLCQIKSLRNDIEKQITSKYDAKIEDIIRQGEFEYQLTLNALMEATDNASANADQTDTTIANVSHALDQKRKDLKAVVARIEHQIACSTLTEITTILRKNNDISQNKLFQNLETKQSTQSLRSELQLSEACLKDIEESVNMMSARMCSMKDSIDKAIEMKLDGDISVIETERQKRADKWKKWIGSWKQTQSSASSKDIQNASAVKSDMQALARSGKAVQQCVGLRKDSYEDFLQNEMNCDLSQFDQKVEDMQLKKEELIKHVDRKYYACRNGSDSENKMKYFEDEKSGAELDSKVNESMLRKNVEFSTMFATLTRGGPESVEKQNYYNQWKQDVMQYNKERKSYLIVTETPKLANSKDMKGADSKEQKTPDLHKISVSFMFDCDIKTWNKNPKTQKMFEAKMCKILNISRKNMKFGKPRSSSTWVDVEIITDMEQGDLSAKLDDNNSRAWFADLDADGVAIVLSYVHIGNWGLDPANPAVMSPSWNRIYGPNSSNIFFGDCSNWTRYTWSNGLDRGGQPYYCPAGWRRYAVNLYNIAGSDDFDSRYGSYCVAYHGTLHKNAGSIMSTFLEVSTDGWRDPGIPGMTEDPIIYVTPSINYASHPCYARPYKINDKCVQFVLQLRVNPRHIIVKQGEPSFTKRQKIDQFEANEIEWLIKPMDNDQSIAIYGLMLRVTDTHPKNLPENAWIDEQYWNQCSPPQAVPKPQMAPGDSVKSFIQSVAKLVFGVQNNLAD